MSDTVRRVYVKLPDGVIASRSTMHDYRFAACGRFAARSYDHFTGERWAVVSMHGDERKARSAAAKMMTWIEGAPLEAQVLPVVENKEELTK